MAEASAPVVPSDELLEWPKKDKRRFLHAVYRVGDLEKTIKYEACCLREKKCVQSIVEFTICINC